MIYFEANNDTLDKCITHFCAPLFASGQFVRGGHSESTTNATVTFIEWRHRVYAVTCHHVLATFFEQSIATGIRRIPSIHSDRSVHQFGSFLPTGEYVWTFRSCRKFPDPTDIGNTDALTKLAQRNLEFPDIAIADMTEHWPVLAKSRNANVLKLDSWTEPNWATTHPTWMAFGFPDTHKTRQGDKIAVPMPRVVVEVSLPPSAERPEFTLMSTLENHHGWRFSGLSGGPVVVADRTRDLCAFVGIVFEGSPGSENPHEHAGTVFGGSDIMLRGYHVTPYTFAKWLKGLRYGVQFPPDDVPPILSGEAV